MQIWVKSESQKLRIIDPMPKDVGSILVKESLKEMVVLE
jgi:hypothetical protein